MRKALAITILVFVSTQLFAKGVEIEEIEFVSHDVSLSGSIVFPKAGKAHSAIVFVHGSGKEKRNLDWAKRFADGGVVALVYDKRGVGDSGGNYVWEGNTGEKNLNLLADDSIAALKVLSEHPKTKGLHLGLTGASQAGWIIPLAAEKTKLADFIVLWSGPVCKVSEEIIYSKYTSDEDNSKAISFEEALKSSENANIWPASLGKDTDPSESLRKLNIPGLWVFGSNDGSIPIDLSIDRLNLLADSGHKYEYVLFSNLGHNNMSETFTTATDWIKRTNQP